MHSPTTLTRRGYADLVGRRERATVYCYRYLWNEFIRTKRLHITVMGLLYLEALEVVLLVYAATVMMYNL